MDEYKLVKKYFSKNKKEEINYKKLIFSFINRSLISCLILLISLCIIKINPKIKIYLKENIYNKNISFSKINEKYESLFGKIYPILKVNDNKDRLESAFNENFVYKNKDKYKDGVKIEVDDNYLMPVLESGIVVYMGNKENYGYTIIIQQVNGIDLWYVGVKNTNIKIYDYVEKSTLLGEVDGNIIYLFYQKDGKFIDYQEYLG